MRHALLVLAFAGCTETRAGLTGTQSLDVEVTSPTSVGSTTMRLPDNARTIVINVTAHDANNDVDTSFTRDVQVYAQFLGTLTPKLGSGTPLATIHVTNGVATNQTVMLPPVFGPTTLWVDDGDDANPTFATGTSPALWYRDPTIADVQTPASETSLDALSVSPLQNKTVTVSTSKYGAQGRLVVTSTFAQGYTVSDSKCADANGNPPCLAGAYDHIEIFTFSAPKDQEGRPIAVGQVISGFAGGVAEFNGLTEVSFPQSFVNDAPDVEPARLSPPVKFQAGRTALGETLNWFNPLSDPQGEINFERNEAAPIEIDAAVVCMLDADYVTYKQWKIDPNGTPGTPADCSHNHNIINVVSAGINDVDPTMLVGKKITKLIGVLRPVEIGSFNVWLVYPRSSADVVQ